MNHGSDLRCLSEEALNSQNKNLQMMVHHLNCRGRTLDPGSHLTHSKRWQYPVSSVRGDCVTVRGKKGGSKANHLHSSILII